MLGLREKVADTAKRAGFLTGGLLLCVVGTAFLTVAAWLALTPIVGVQMTATIVAATYLGIGLILIAVGVRSSSVKNHYHPPPQETASPKSPPIVQAFMYGLQAGVQADRARHS